MPRRQSYFAAKCLKCLPHKAFDYSPLCVSEEYVLSTFCRDTKSCKKVKATEIWLKINRLG